MFVIWPKFPTGFYTGRWILFFFFYHLYLCTHTFNNTYQILKLHVIIKTVLKTSFPILISLQNTCERTRGKLFSNKKEVITLLTSSFPYPFQWIVEYLFRIVNIKYTYWKWSVKKKMRLIDDFKCVSLLKQVLCIGIFEYAPKRKFTEIKFIFISQGKVFLCVSATINVNKLRGKVLNVFFFL